MDLKARSHRIGKLRMAVRAAGRALPEGLPPVLVLTDPDRSGNLSLLAGRIPPGWGVIYRHFGAPDRVETARMLAKAAKRRRFFLLISADPTLACRVGADGVHWPERCRPRARIWAGRFNLMTTSSHSRAGLAQAVKQGFAGALHSTVFASNSPSAGPAIGALRYRIMTRKTGGRTLNQTGVYALGGVGWKTAAQVSCVGGLSGVSGLIPGPSSASRSELKG